MDQDQFFAAFLPFWIGCFAITIVVIVAQWKVYQKAGKPWWWILLMLIPVVNIIYAIWVLNLLSKSFGKDVGFTMGLLFLGFIFYPILGFGNARYLGPYGDRATFQAQNPDFDFDKGPR